MEINLNATKPPDGWNSYLLTFKDEDVHPLEKVNMKGRAVRIFAPNDEAAVIIVKHRFGKSFYQLHNMKKIRPLKLIQYPLGIYEILVFDKNKQKYKLN